MRLNEIRDNRGATKNRKRVARGQGTGVGKTAGRGHKGQKSRSGVAVGAFEGGQLPMYIRMPKRGFTNIFAKNYETVNIVELSRALERKTIDESKPVNNEALKNAGLIRDAKSDVKLLGKGDIKNALQIEVAMASKQAQDKIVKSGGKVTVLSTSKR
jgi:large subunit ribosomal protein L15